MKSFNLSDWALGHRSLVWYFMIAFMAAGLFAYLQLGRQEDPDFTIKTMVIQAQWPGASPEEMTRQVTDRIEKKLEELESLDYTKSVTVAGQTTVFVYLRDTTKAADVAPTWARVRNMIADIKGDFPQGVIGPGFNDRFGDVFGNIYAFTSDGLSQRQLRDQVEDVRAKILTVPNVGKVDILGAQDEVIYLEFSTRKIAALGLDVRSIMASLQGQNAVAPSGVFEAGPERISVRVNGQFTSEASLKAINLRVNDRFFPLTDVATVTRGYLDPARTLFRYNGQPAIALAIGMKSGANLLKFGEALKDEMSKILADLPIGVGVHLVADQPVVVEHAVSGFTEALFEAVVIVLVISFLSLGLRAGLVVAIAIPLVLAITFVVMAYTGISLQRISLGALIIALGLLVDDAMIAVEMMVARLEVGDPLDESRDTRLYVDRLSHVDRHAGHRCGVYPDWSQHQQCRRIHLHLVRGYCSLLDRVVDCRGAVHAAARGHHPARQDARSSRREGSARTDVLTSASRLHASPLDNHLGDGCCLLPCSVRDEIRAAAVLPLVGPG